MLAPRNVTDDELHIKSEEDRKSIGREPEDMKNRHVKQEFEAPHAAVTASTNCSKRIKREMQEVLDVEGSGPLSKQVKRVRR